MLLQYLFKQCSNTNGCTQKTTITKCGQKALLKELVSVNDNRCDIKYYMQSHEKVKILAKF